MLYDQGYDDGYKIALDNILDQLDFINKLIQRERTIIREIIYNDIFPPSDCTDEFKEGFSAARFLIMDKVGSRK